MPAGGVAMMIDAFHPVPEAIAIASRIESVKARCILRGMTQAEADALWSRACEAAVTSEYLDPFAAAEAEIARIGQDDCAKTLAQREISR